MNKFDPSSPDRPPDSGQLAQLHDALVTMTEAYRLYAALERHPRVIDSPKSQEMFVAFTEQVSHDLAVLDEQLGLLLQLAHTTAGRLAEERDLTEVEADLFVAPDAEPVDLAKSVFTTVRRAFQQEDALRHLIGACLQTSQERHQLKLELQLKMIALSGDQRCKLLEDRYGFARSKTLLFQGLRRQTTRFLSVLQGDKRRDIDK
jgi:hypothetical protein